MTERVACVQALKDMIRRISGGCRQRMDGGSVTFGQFAVLRIVAQDGPIAMGALAHHLGLSLAAVTGVIDRLVRADLVARYRSDADRRRIWVDLTAYGAQEFDRLNAERRQYVGRLFGSLDDGRLQQLLALLRTIEDGLEMDTQETTDIGGVSELSGSHRSRPRIL